MGCITQCDTPKLSLCSAQCATCMFFCLRRQALRFSRSRRLRHASQRTRMDPRRDFKTGASQSRRLNDENILMSDSCSNERFTKNTKPPGACRFVNVHCITNSRPLRIFGRPRNRQVRNTQPDLESVLPVLQAPSIAQNSRLTLYWMTRKVRRVGFEHLEVIVLGSANT
jgi:hypothetical protein